MSPTVPPLPRAAPVGRVIALSKSQLTRPSLGPFSQSFPLLGFPLTISSLTTFSSHLAKHYPTVWLVVERLESTQPFPTAFEPLGPNVPLHESKPSGSAGEKDEPLEEVSRGRRLFNSIYSKVAGRVVESLRWGHPNLVDCALKLIVSSKSPTVDASLA